MRKVLKAILLSGAVLGAAATAQAKELPLPGKTLRVPVAGANRAGIEQPAKNVKNVLGGTISVPCPHLGGSLRDLLLYARDNWPATYRQAVNLRRTGFTQEQTRDWLEQQLCTLEGY